MQTFQYACIHGWPTSPEHARGGGESFKMAALLSEWYEKLELSYNSGYESRVTPPREHNLTGTFVNATLLTYLLNGEILLFIQT